MYVRKLEALARIHEVQSDNAYFNKSIEGRIMEYIAPDVVRISDDEFGIRVMGVLSEYKNEHISFEDAVLMIKKLRNEREN